MSGGILRNYDTLIPPEIKLETTEFKDNNYPHQTRFFTELALKISIFMHLHAIVVFYKRQQKENNIMRLYSHTTIF